MFSCGKRTMEPEAMETLEEVYAYDRLTLKYLAILNNGFVESIINASPTSGEFLDVGCGTGRIAIGVALYNPSARVTGVDLSDNMVTVASDNANKNAVPDRVKFKKGDGKQLPFQDHTFDSVFCHQLIHHIPDPLYLVKEMIRVLKPDGALMIRDLIRVPRFLVPFHVNILGLTYSRLMKKEYRDSICASLSKEEWKALCLEAGIEAACVTYQFITHQGIERPAKNRRESPLSVPTPIHVKLFKKLYTSISG